MIFRDPPLILEETRLRDGRGVIELSDLPDPQPAHPRRPRNATPLLERLWRIALCDVERNIVKTPTGVYFGAGASFGAKVFTRDIAFSGVLALHQLYPDILRASLDYTLRLRMELGFRAPRAYIVPEIQAPWREYPGDENAFVQEWGTNNLMRRTDDVVRFWALGAMAERAASSAEWAALRVVGERCFRELYDPFYDPETGLYRGQASFIDVPFDTPRYQANGYPAGWGIADALLQKATSTNALYVHALRLMARAAAETGDGVESGRWAARADALAGAMRDRLRRPDGVFEMYLDRHNRPAGRVEALGTGLAVLLGVVEGDAARAAVAALPVTAMGVPLFAPFYPGDSSYHNHSSWPFVDAFFLLARARATGRDETGRILALTARVCRDARGFRELVDFRTGEPKGSASQLWTAAAFLGAALKGEERTA